MFTVRKEAVNSVCSHLSKTEQLLTPPTTPTLHADTETGRDPCVVYFWGDRKSKKKKKKQEKEYFFDCVQSAAVRLSDRRATGLPREGPEVIDRAFYLRYRVSPLV